jgi:hypothetical protein
VQLSAAPVERRCEGVNPWRGRTDGSFEKETIICIRSFAVTWLKISGSFSVGDVFSWKWNAHQWFGDNYNQVLQLILGQFNYMESAFYQFKSIWNFLIKSLASTHEFNFQIKSHYYFYSLIVNHMMYYDGSSRNHGGKKYSSYIVRPHKQWILTPLSACKKHLSRWLPTFQVPKE